MNNKYIPDYIKNFNKKYYLFLKYTDNSNKTHKIILYSGSLRSIIKYTSYKSLYKNVSVDNQEDLLYILKRVFRKKYNLNISEILKNCYVFMSPDKNGKNKEEVVYSNYNDVLYTTPKDLLNSVKKLMVTKEKINDELSYELEFIKEVLKLVDPDYEQKLKEGRDSHNRTTTLDILRVQSSKVNNHYRLGYPSFEKVMLFDEELIYTAFEEISKDYKNKKQLMDLIKKYTKITNFLNKEQLYNRYLKLNKKLEDDNETKDDIELSIYHVLKQNNLVYEIKEEIASAKKKKSVYNLSDGFLEEKLKAETYKDLVEMYYDTLDSKGKLRYNDNGEPLEPLDELDDKEDDNKWKK